MPSAATWEACQLSDYANEGTWPVGGGTLDQADSFLAAHALVQFATFKLTIPPKKPNG